MLYEGKMHKSYKNPVLQELRDQQVRYLPLDKKLEQLERVELLFREIEDDREYSYKYLCLRITEFMTEIYEDTLMAGKDVRRDLLFLIEDLSDSAKIDSAGVPEKIWTIDELCRRFHVASKTISRWRKEKLSGRKFLFGDKKRIGFLDSAVDWFVSQDPERVARGSRFSPLTPDEKKQLIREGRKLAALGLSQTETARRLAKTSGRSVETVRYTIKAFSRRNADIPIFSNSSEPLRDDAKKRIFQGFRRGESAQTLAAKFRRTIGSIYRIVAQMRAMHIKNLPISFIDSPEFDMIRSGKQEKHVCGPMPPSDREKPKEKSKRNPRQVPDGLPQYLNDLYDVPLLTPDQELHLFRKMNYLKYKAATLRDTLDVNRPNTNLMKRIETLYDETIAVKNEIVSANLRLVVSIAKRHVGPMTNLFELISDGNLSLIRAVEKFDYTRGNRFSTYATWAVMRNFARTIPDEKKYRERFHPTDSEMFEFAIDERADEQAEEKAQWEREIQVDRFLQELNDQEQRIIVSRYGIGNDTEPQTLREVGSEMGVTKERIRQLEIQAIAKLRKAAESELIDIPSLK